MVRLDKFQVGDKVTWSDDEHANLTDGCKAIGNGPFVIISVIDRPFESYLDYDGDVGLSNWKLMGHTQHVEIDKGDDLYSGAFFKLWEA